MTTLTVKGATKYIKENYGEPKHNISYLVKACKETAKTNKLKALDIFFLLIENKPIKEAFTHSYGFHTANGRHLIDTTINNYNNY